MKITMLLAATLLYTQIIWANYGELNITFKADNETAAFTNSPFFPQNSKVPLLNRIDFIKNSLKFHGEMIYTLRVNDKTYEIKEHKNLLHYFADKFFEAFGDNKIYFLHSISSPPFSFLPAEILRFNDFYIKSFRVSSKDWEKFIESAHPFPELTKEKRQDYLLSIIKRLGYKLTSIQDYTHLDYYRASSKFGLVCESQRKNETELNINYYCKHDVDFTYSLQFKIIN